jgi:hypothetical protein
VALSGRWAAPGALALMIAAGACIRHAEPPPPAHATHGHTRLRLRQTAETSGGFEIVKVRWRLDRQSLEPGPEPPQLSAGPVTVFDGDTFAGEHQLWVAATVRDTGPARQIETVKALFGFRSADGEDVHITARLHPFTPLVPEQPHYAIEFQRE